MHEYHVLELQIEKKANDPPIYKFTIEPVTQLSLWLKR